MLGLVTKDTVCLLGFPEKNRSSILSQIFITSEFEKDCSTSEFEKDSCKTTKSDFYIYCK